MTESKVVRAFGVLGALVAASVLAMGCSAPPDGQTGGTAPEVKDQGVSTENLPAGYIYVQPDAPLNRYCVIPGVTLVPGYLPAHFVEKLPTTWARGYSFNMSYTPSSHVNDGYSIPFPTPWATPTSDVPDPYAYEHALWSIPSTRGFEYLVHDIVPSGDFLAEDTGHSFFMVGIPAISDYSAAYNLAVQNTGGNVQARVKQCVRVFTRMDSVIHDTGEYFLVYDEHDPRNPPD